MLARCLDLTFSQSSEEILEETMLSRIDTRWMDNGKFCTYVHVRSIGRARDDGCRTRWPLQLRPPLSQNAERCSADIVQVSHTVVFCSVAADVKVGAEIHRECG